MLLPARGTIHFRRFGRAADQLSKNRVAILTLIFVDRHIVLIGSLTVQALARGIRGLNRRNTEDLSEPCVETNRLDATRFHPALPRASLAIAMRIPIGSTP